MAGIANILICWPFCRQEGPDVTNKSKQVSAGEAEQVDCTQVICYLLTSLSFFNYFC